MIKRRSKIQQKLVLIENIKKYPNFPQSRLMSVSGFAYTSGIETLNQMIKNDIVKSNNHTFICTQKANKILQKWKILCELLGEDPIVQ